MDSGADRPGEAAPEVGLLDLVDLCRRLNAAGVEYLVYGGLACLLHGHERMTRDADLFLGDSDTNLARALAVLRGWGEGLAAELSAEDLRQNVVVRLCDRFVVDLAVRVWNLEWASAWRCRRLVAAEGVDIPVLSREDLIRSKLTYRQQDRWDVQVLRSLRGPEPGRPAEAPAGIETRS
jgi:hypothetical protein